MYSRSKSNQQANNKLKHRSKRGTLVIMRKNS
uniref:Uncharacterized protein n=1 Tax=Anguilla anguilla TaxID=7936 RepID=A0A0E9PF92_ANGAN